MTFWRWSHEVWVWFSKLSEVLLKPVGVLEFSWGIALKVLQRIFCQEIILCNEAGDSLDLSEPGIQSTSNLSCKILEMNSELRGPENQRPTDIGKARLQPHRMHIPLSFQKMIELAPKVGGATACDKEAAFGWIDNVTGRRWFDDLHLLELLKRMFVWGTFWRIFYRIVRRKTWIRRSRDEILFFSSAGVVCVDSGVWGCDGASKSWTWGETNTTPRTGICSRSGRRAGEEVEFWGQFYSLYCTLRSKGQSGIFSEGLPLFLDVFLSSELSCSYFIVFQHGSNLRNTIPQLEHEFKLMSNKVGILRSKFLRTPRAHQMPHKTRHPLWHRNNRRPVRHSRQLQTWYVICPFPITWPILFTT